MSMTTVLKLVEERYGSGRDNPTLFAGKCQTLMQVSVEGSYAWAVAVFLRAWALEQTDDFSGAARLIEKLLSSKDSSDLDLHPYPALPPLTHPHPLHPNNAKALQKRLNTVSALAQASAAAYEREESAPSILAADSPQKLMYRVQLRSEMPVGIRFSFQEDMSLSTVDLLTVPVMLTSDMSLFRSVDFTEPVILSIRVIVAPAGSLIPPVSLASAALVYSTPETVVLDHKGKGVIPVSVSFHPSASFHQETWVIWIYLLPTNNDRVVPLLIGPMDIILSDEERDEEFQSCSPIRVSTVQSQNPDLNPSHLFTFEEPDSGIHGRLWDSAVVLCDAIPNLLSSIGFIGTKDAPVPKVMDLGCGVGTVGLLIASTVRAHVVLSDLPDCVSLPKKNLIANMDLITKQGSHVDIEGMWWGDEEKLAQLGTFDVIVAADVVYETEYFDDLFKTLECLCNDQSEIWLVYKRRGLSLDEESGFFDRICQTFKEVSPSDKVLGNVAESIGCFLRRYRRAS
ncbi:hypothetical protein HDU83_009569 [Entophlyctis luteolus]|nr:hypothetical protein HDU83_009569 [Entophlyctis luteolus]